MSTSTAIRDQTLNAWFRNRPWPTLAGPMTISLHTDDPGGSGAYEVSGGRYARQPVSFDPPTGGSVEASAPLTFTGMPAVTVAFVGAWAGNQFIQSAELAGGAQPVNAGNTFSLANLSFSLV